MTARPAAGTCARSSQTNSGTPIMPIIHAIFVRRRGSEYSDSGNVSSSHAATASKEIGRARSSGTSSTIGNTTSAAIQLQNAWKDMRRAARVATSRSYQGSTVVMSAARPTRLVNAICPASRCVAPIKNGKLKNSSSCCSDWLTKLTTKLPTRRRRRSSRRRTQGSTNNQNHPSNASSATIRARSSPRRTSRNPSQPAAKLIAGSSHGQTMRDAEEATKQRHHGKVLGVRLPRRHAGGRAGRPRSRNGTPNTS